MIRATACAFDEPEGNFLGQHIHLSSKASS